MEGTWEDRRIVKSTWPTYKVDVFRGVPDIQPSFNKLFDILDNIIAGSGRYVEIASPTVKEAAEKARAKLVQYYTKANTTMLLCMVLDPQYKLAYFKKHDFPEEEIEAVVTLYIFHSFFL